MNDGSSIKEMMDRDARTNRAQWINSVAEKMLIRSAVKFREAEPNMRRRMMSEAFTAAEELVDEQMRRFEAAQSPRRVPRAV
jgi:hypothetical protein